MTAKYMSALSRLRRGVDVDLRSGRITEPSTAEMRKAMFDGTVWAACPFDCEIQDPEGYCEHGRPSWLRYYGLT